ncbi:MAG TPA: RodZ domain-containing protein [Vicinamibacterales bacterium]
MTDRSKEPFDERAALDALEQFQSEIRRYRRKREAVTNDFEEFVRTFPPADDVFPTEKSSAPPAAGPDKTPRIEPPSQTPASKAPSPASAPQAVSLRPEAGSSVDHASNRAPSVHESPQAGRDPGGAPAVSRKPPEVRTPPPKKPDPRPAPVLTTPAPARSNAPRLAALLVIALTIAGAVYWNANRGNPAGEPAGAPSATETAAPETAMPETTPAPETPAPTPEPPPPAPPPVTGSEITTLRPVWVRVIADGKRVVERELPAGSKVPFTVEESLVIRAGDAGAVRLILRGADHGTLGADGDVVTRTFTIEADR